MKSNHPKKEDFSIKHWTKLKEDLFCKSLSLSLITFCLSNWA